MFLATMLSMEMCTLLGSLGLVAGLLAGLVGLGGGIILAPLLLYVPPLLGLESLDMKTVARFTILQSLCSTAAAGMAHGRARLVHQRLVRLMGPTILVAACAGAIVSEAQAVTADALLGLFASLATLAAMLMAFGPPNEPAEDPVNADMPFRKGRAVLVSTGVGFVGGMVGQSGAFLTIPLLVHVLRLPIRLAIGSSLFITFFAAVAGSIGKLIGGGDVPWMSVAVLVAGSLVGSQLGAAIGHRTPTAYLRYSLAILIAAAAARMWFHLIFEQDVWL